MNSEVVFVQFENMIKISQEHLAVEKRGTSWCFQKVKGALCPAIELIQNCEGHVKLTDIKDFWYVAIIANMY